MAVPVNLEGVQLCRKRRLMPGASTSKTEFQKMFEGYLEHYTHGLTQVKVETPDNAANILTRTAALKKFVLDKHPDLSEEMVALFVAALVVYRMRLVDMFIREHVHLVWVMEGDRFLRVHNGMAYFYHDDGAFQPHKGVPPEATFGRVKRFLLRLEGSSCYTQ